MSFCTLLLNIALNSFCQSRGVQNKVWPERQFLSVVLAFDGPSSIAVSAHKRFWWNPPPDHLLSREESSSSFIVHHLLIQWATTHKETTSRRKKICCVLRGVRAGLCSKCMGPDTKLCSLKWKTKKTLHWQKTNQKNPDVHMLSLLFDLFAQTFKTSQKRG